ncbi:hypothetical protein HAX54_043919 [Datura stramonium]|uniref:Uncharacterized protein n=1 Tax=Datura stramonium TaxID=4076 RepID=A0ABS8W566_DATST|nr:hypothetical protein [Datura stramonium]
MDSRGPYWWNNCNATIPPADKGKTVYQASQQMVWCSGVADAPPTERPGQDLKWPADNLDEMAPPWSRRDVANLGFPARSVKPPGLNGIRLEGSYIEKAIKMVPNLHSKLTLDEEEWLYPRQIESKLECPFDSQPALRINDSLRFFFHIPPSS